MSESNYLCWKSELIKNSKEPLYRQLSDLISRAIEAGEIARGEKLPPIRKIAAALGVNTVTIVSAYKYLESKKIVYSIIGSGTYVSELSLEEQRESECFNPSTTTHSETLFQSMSNDKLNNMDVINFAKGSVSPNLFPVDEFKDLFNAVLIRDKGNAFDYEQSQGYEPLRDGLSTYLTQFGIKVSSEKIQIISGAQQGIDIISKAFLQPHDFVLTENPTYYGAVGAFLSRGAEVIGVPLENDGIDISKLTAFIKLYKPKFLYVMTYYQTPTCICYSIEKKRMLIELAEKYNFYIIEEDNQSDFHFKKEQIVPLKALDYKNRVVYIKSFSKLLMPGLRLGFMALPKPVLSKVLSAKHTTDIETSGFLQRAFSLFIENGDWNNHIVKMRNVFQKRYNTLIQCSKRLLSNSLSFETPDGGLSIWYQMPERMNKSSVELALYLAENGIIVTPGDIFSLHEKPQSGIRLSFADVTEEQIEIGVSHLGILLKMLQ